MTQRLGPPQAKPFPAKPPTAEERSSGSGGVFNRLGASVNPEPAAAGAIVKVTNDLGALFIETAGAATSDILSCISAKLQVNF